jgi:hypothetical protein
MAPAVVLGGLNQPFDFSLGQVLARPVSGVGLAHRQSNCAFFGGWTDYFEVVNGRHFPLPRLDDCEYIVPSSTGWPRKIACPDESF